MSISPWDMNILSSHSNLQNFLRCVTPAIPVLPQTEGPPGSEGTQRLDDVAFSLGDLWHFYERPSSYGIGVPVVLDVSESVVQYYSPSLSAIQLFTKHPITEGVSEPRPNGSRTDGVAVDGVAGGTGADASIGTNGVGSNPFGHLYLQYSETCSPYDRLPLTVKINELAVRYPRLKTFSSVDLSPYSWMAVAWYPIYQIPQRDTEDLAACFITYHYLSTSFPGVTRGEDEKDGSFDTAQRIISLCSNAGDGELSLTVFATATYRMVSRGTVWLNPRTRDQERLNAHKVAAHDWLKRLNFHHHDFTFFTSLATCTL